jgi:DNA-binding response OmpR family regulator
MSHKILLIDDDELILLSVESLLEAEGFEVQTASNGDEGLAKAAENHFDVFLLDIIMPGKSGFEVCTALRAMEDYAKVPIVMLSAKSAEADQEKGLGLGVTRFLPKPIDPDVLVEVLQEVVAQS